MTPPLAPAKWTLAEYHQMVSAGILRARRVELLNGEIVERASEGEPHAYYRGSVADYLRELLGHRAQIREGHLITLPHHHSEPEPDIAVVQRLGKVYLQHHPYSPFAGLLQQRLCPYPIASALRSNILKGLWGFPVLGD